MLKGEQLFVACSARDIFLEKHRQQGKKINIFF